ncbi:hypothetical protein Rhe02_82040 [Rhizocola hellebori]|uniref:Uncharacterized protein n=1 Tax=Rhizocola hellebori TaxID=1392758 RepID=A0A8J3VL19_9ACTN|nr:hypothetical protein Rhe02_82040 [Rhizocola hellebori]
MGVTALALAGCGDAAPTTAEPSLSWQEPANYEYTVASTCGERLLIGTFKMTVAQGKVTEVVRKDNTLPEVKPENYPSLKDLLDEYLTAKKNGAHLAKLETDPADGHPTKIDLDPIKNAIDDEACYRISNYTPRS